jgi:hypothetical protein
MRRGITAAAIVSLFVSPAINGQSAFTEEEFTEDDFSQFFNLIVDGKISKEKMRERCMNQSIGFTFAGKDLVHEGAPQRIFYNVSRENTSVDGRTLRAKHFNASFGEWTGAVFKPLCPGLYALSIDFSTGSGDGVTAEDVYVHLYVKRAGEDRPGQKVVSAVRTGPGVRGSGHATLALPLHSGDEISTYSEIIGAEKTRILRNVTFTAYKVAHLEDYVEAIDMEAFSEDIIKLKGQN